MRLCNRHERPRRAPEELEAAVFASASISVPTPVAARPVARCDQSAGTATLDANPCRRHAITRQARLRLAAGSSHRRRPAAAMQLPTTRPIVTVLLVWHRKSTAPQLSCRCHAADASPPHERSAGVQRTAMPVALHDQLAAMQMSLNLRAVAEHQSRSCHAARELPPSRFPAHASSLPSACRPGSVSLTVRCHRAA